ncbi:MAG: tyrosine-type recombinase/integrase [Muribaculaceae bacterium]|nr:tyrosine-type recombinase/integrase [Muribaculaceae bacterium]
MIDSFLTYLRNEVTYSPHTVYAYGCDLRQFAVWLTGGAPERFDAASVTVQDIRAWLGQLARKGLTPRSLRRKLLTLRSFWHWMRKTGYAAHNPAADVELPKLGRPLPHFVRETELESITAESEFETADWEEYRDVLIIDMLYSTGIRRSELLSLNDADIQLDAGEIKVIGKGNKERLIPIPTQLCRRIARYRELRYAAHGAGAPKFLLSHKGRPLNNDALSRIVKVKLASSTAERKTPHVLRHSCATALLRDGAEINSVKELLGHNSLATTQIYTHLSFSELKKNYKSAHPRAKKN